jgi:hypothetical protein
MSYATLTNFANAAAVDAALGKALTAVQPQAGAVKLGGETAYLNIAADGTPTLAGDATVFDDLDFAMTFRANSSENPPVWTQLASTGIYAWAFENGDIAYFQRQIPHLFKTGSTWRAHVHWMPTTTATYTGTWTLTLTGHVTSATPSEAPLISTITRTGSFSVSATAWQGHLTQLDVAGATPESPIDGSGWGISTILFGKLTLTLSAGAACILSGFDMHGEIDALGSKEEYVK